MSDAVLKYGEPENYVNRELSWLEFNYRILGEARDKTTPLFERLKFLSITASNLDEFFMVRVASLKDMVHANYTKRDIAGMTAQEQLDAIDGKTHELVENQYRTYNRMLLPLLKQHGLRVVTEHEKLTKEEAVYVDRYFEESVYPVLTPMAVDSSRPFPLIQNKTLNNAALVRKKKRRRRAGICDGLRAGRTSTRGGAAVPGGQIYHLSGRSHRTEHRQIVLKL